MTTVKELIEKLERVEDKEQTIHVWDRFGYYGSNLVIEIETDQEERPLVINTTD